MSMASSLALSVALSITRSIASSVASSVASSSGFLAMCVRGMTVPILASKLALSIHLHAHFMVEFCFVLRLLPVFSCNLLSNHPVESRLESLLEHPFARPFYGRVLLCAQAPPFSHV
jgi:hypothetical protein